MFQVWEGKGSLPLEFYIRENIFRDEGKIKNSPMKEMEESVSSRLARRELLEEVCRKKFYQEETENIQSQRKGNRDNKCLSKFNRLLISHRVV